MTPAVFLLGVTCKVAIGQMVAGHEVGSTNGMRDIFSGALLSAYDENNNYVLSQEEFVTMVRDVYKGLRTEKEIVVHGSTTGCLKDIMDNHTSCLQTKCLNIDDLFQLYNFTSPDALSKHDITSILPSILYELRHQHCPDIVNISNTRTLHEKPSEAEIWGYGIGFVTSVQVLSNVGGCLAPIMDKNYFKLVLMFMVSLGVGSMLGTAIFVLIPESLDLMNNEYTEDAYLGKAGATVITIYAFFLVEKIINIVASRKERKKNLYELSSITIPEEDLGKEQNVVQNGGVVEHVHSHVTENSSIATVAWMVLIGDGLHNFMDGLAIAAGFTESILLGLTVSIAVICEEVPHELGDIAVLLHSGMSIKKAILYNFMAALTCYVGLVVGIQLGENTEANRWIFAISAGMFLYMSLVILLPEVNKASDMHNSASALSKFLSQNTGLLLGLSIIFLLANFAGDINV